MTKAELEERLRNSRKMVLYLSFGGTRITVGDLLDHIAALEAQLAQRDEIIEFIAELSTEWADDNRAKDERIRKLREAHENIANPILAAQRYAQAKGPDYEVDHKMALQLGNEPNHLKEIARAALAADAKEGEGK